MGHRLARTRLRGILFLTVRPRGLAGRGSDGARGARGAILAEPFMGKANGHREIGTRIA